MKVIIISGTPGTGKTRLAKKLAEKIKFKYVDVAKLIKEKNISEGYDKKRKCDVVEIKRLNKELVKVIYESKCKGLIIDSHLSHYLAKKYVDLCIITKCELKELKKRLMAKRYSRGKIKENLDSEIFDVCLNEAAENKHNIHIVETSKRVKYKEIISKIKES